MRTTKSEFSGITHSILQVTFPKQFRMFLSLKNAS
jgi:hypothetical protein